jgi:hypothetical protein
MGKYGANGTPYRTPATPDCACARCQVSPWRLSLAWMFWRIIVASLLAIGLVTAVTFGIVHVHRVGKTQDACRDSVVILEEASTPYVCAYEQQQMIIDAHDRKTEVRCICPGHVAGPLVTHVVP